MKVEIDRSLYKNRGRSREMRKALEAWSFPDSKALVVMMSPAMVSAMGGDSLVVPANLQITYAQGSRKMGTVGPCSQPI